MPKCNLKHSHGLQLEFSHLLATGGTCVKVSEAVDVLVLACRCYIMSTDTAVRYGGRKSIRYYSMVLRYLYTPSIDLLLFKLLILQLVMLGLTDLAVTVT